MFFGTLKLGLRGVLVPWLWKAVQGSVIAAWPRPAAGLTVLHSKPARTGRQVHSILLQLQETACETNIIGKSKAGWQCQVYTELSTHDNLFLLQLFVLRAMVGSY